MTDFDFDIPDPEKARSEYQKILERTYELVDSKENTILIESMLNMETESLYRYRTVDTNNLDALLNDKIYFSKPQYFNDPFDCSFFVDANRARNEIINGTIQVTGGEKSYYSELTEEKFKNLSNPDNKDSHSYFESLKQLLRLMDEEISNMNDFPNKIPFEHIIKKIRDSFLLEIRENIGVACLSETIISILMWSHYADNHKGFAIEYDFDNSFKAEYPGILFPVIYTDKRCDITKQVINTMRGIIDDGKIDVPNHIDMIIINTYKGNEWEYEKEWRLISYNNAPYAQIKPKAIYFGVEMPSNDRDIIQKLIHGKGLEEYQMYVDENEQRYALKFREIWGNNV